MRRASWACAGRIDEAWVEFVENAQVARPPVPLRKSTVHSAKFLFQLGQDPVAQTPETHTAPNHQQQHKKSRCVWQNLKIFSNLPRNDLRGLEAWAHVALCLDAPDACQLFSCFAFVPDIVQESWRAKE